MALLISVLFTQNTGEPATGLALADIDIYLSRRAIADGTVTAVWNPQNPTEEVTGGIYTRSLATPDFDTYEYFAYAQYTGAVSLDVNYSLQAAAPTSTTGNINSDVSNKVADHTVRRSFATAAASSDGDTKSFRSLLGSIAKLVNRLAVSIDGTTLTIYEADDATALGTQTIATSATALPITELDTS